MVEAFRGLPARLGIVDGEICLSGASGRPDFDALMREMRQARPGPFHLVVYAFDLLHLNGWTCAHCRSGSVGRNSSTWTNLCTACSSSTSSATPTT
jgi:ATP-dependent DNA ligase